MRNGIRLAMLILRVWRMSLNLLSRERGASVGMKESSQKSAKIIIGEDGFPQPKKSTCGWSPEEYKKHSERISAKREKILSAILNDRAIHIKDLSEKIQKLATPCGLSQDDAVLFKHTDSYVMHCPCAMLFPALTRVSVKVPRLLLNEDEPDCVVAYLDEDRSKDWFVLTVGEKGKVEEVYPSLKEARTSRFGTLFSVLSLVKNAK